MRNEPIFPNQLAEICSKAADLVLDPPARPSDVDGDPKPQWWLEHQLWLDRGTEEPVKWISETTSTYLIEAAHEVRALGILLDAGVVTAALDPLVRAVVERAGRVKWILAQDVVPEGRGARAGLEVGVSLAAYRQAAERAGAPSSTCKALTRRLQEHRARLEELFAVERPPSDPCDKASPVSTDMTQWTAGQERYPGYVENAEYALENDNFSRRQGAAWYDHLSGFSHASVAFSRELRGMDPDGVMTFTYTFEDLEKAVRVAALGLLEAARYWMTYYDADPTGFRHRVNAIADELDAISVTGAD